MVKNTCTVPPATRANLLVGKLLLLHQTRPRFAKEFTHNVCERGNPLQGCNIPWEHGKISRSKRTQRHSSQSVVSK